MGKGVSRRRRCRDHTPIAFTSRDAIYAPAADLYLYNPRTTYIVQSVTSRLKTGTREPRLSLVNARSGRKWTGSGPVTSLIWTGPIRTESVTPYSPLLDLYLLGYRRKKCRLHALTVRRSKRPETRLQHLMSTSCFLLVM